MIFFATFKTFKSTIATQMFILYVPSKCIIFQCSDQNSKNNNAKSIFFLVQKLWHDRSSKGLTANEGPGRRMYRCLPPGRETSVWFFGATQPIIISDKVWSFFGPFRWQSSVLSPTWLWKPTSLLLFLAIMAAFLWNPHEMTQSSLMWPWPVRMVSYKRLIR